MVRGLTSLLSWCRPPLPLPLSFLHTMGALPPRQPCRYAYRRGLRTAERLLTAAAEAKVASPRTIINFCELGGNHTDPNPPNRGKGKNKQARQGGRGRGRVANFYNRSTDNPQCPFFQMGKCIHNKSGGNCKNEHLGVPQTITCTLPKEGEYCRNGKDCLYLHPSSGAGSCQVCRSMKGEGDRGLGEIGEFQSAKGGPSLGRHTARPAQA
eukprot:scaffold1375_cov96-Isochrysis_galbana.AAC.12